MTSAVELNQLTKTYGSVTAVDALNLSIGVGEVVALLGPNGAGKSTTTEMILGLTQPTSGTVTVFGTDPLTAVRRGDAGGMLQNGALLDEVKVGQMLKLVHGLHAHPLPLSEVIERAAIDDVLNSNTSKLSGGQAQRVRYALGIMGDPKLLLLDEPTVAMDVETRRRFWEGIRSFAGTGRTVVFATHYLEEADEFADRVVMMAHGRLAADGTGAQIKQTVAGRTVSFAGGVSGDWRALPGVTSVDDAETRVVLRTTDSDATLRALIGTGLPVRDIEITSASLEDAFIQLTSK